MDYSFSEKQRRIECQASDEAKLLQNEVNNFKKYPWKYDSAILWFTAEVINFNNYFLTRYFFFV